VIESLAQPFQMDELHFSVSCSIGIAMFPADGLSMDDLIKCADTAMYSAKERGRANYRFYQPQMNMQLLSRMKMEHQMRQAMEGGIFRLHYQPQVQIDNGELVGFEALIRWPNGEEGLIPPGAFIPLAEESGYIVTIGTWVLGEAVRQAALWQRAGVPVPVSVNVSPLQFQQHDFVDRVAAALHSEGLDPTLLELELTESILVRDLAEALERLNDLAALGVSLAIDDFGTGYSSLAYLKKFPIHKLKIDRSFISGLPDDESDHAIVSAIVQMGRALNLLTVAEGVETEGQRAVLELMHCDHYQGFLCAPGVPPDQVDGRLGKMKTRLAAVA
jgi:EAL domain-containing protein (putative c-di-GMP-specific phosphodiesterase class I)